MTRWIAGLVVLATFVTAVACAQDKPALPIAVELDKAKAEYRGVVDKARDEVLKAFTAEEKKLLDGRLSIAEKVRQTEQLQAERKAFEADGKVPTSAALKSAAGRYDTAVSQARQTCEKAFDAAAERYLPIDLAKAKAVLAEKTTYFDGVAAKAAPVDARPSMARLTTVRTTEFSVEELRKSASPQSVQEIERRIAECVSTVRDAGYGHVVVGQVKLSGETSPQDIIGQMEILEGGYFVDAVATRDAPIAFWCPGYQTAFCYPKLDVPVEWLGEIALERLAGFGGSVRGRAVVNGCEYAPQLTIRANYEPWPFNAASKDKNALTARRTVLQNKLRDRLKVETTYDATTGEFEVADLVGGRIALNWENEDRTSRQTLLVDADGAEHHEVGDLQMYGSRQGAIAAHDPASRVPDATGELNVLLKQFGNERVGGQTLAARVAADLETLKTYRTTPNGRPAVLLVGRIQADKNAAQTVQAQSQISPSGCFSFLVREGVPVGFRLHGYDPLDYVPRGSEGLVESAGVLQMKRTPTSEQASLEGKLMFEGGAPQRYSMTLHDDIDMINWHNASVGTHGSRGMATVPASLKGDGSFRCGNLSPIRYWANLSIPGFVDQYPKIRLDAGERKSGVVFRLFRERAIEIAYVMSADGNFQNAPASSARLSLKAKAPLPPGQAKTAAQTPPHCFLQQLGGAVASRNFYQPANLVRLGSGELSDFRNVDARLLEVNASWNDVLLKEGNVYLLDGQHSPSQVRWLMFQVKSIRSSEPAGQTKKSGGK
jgi:hypothetical protein